MGLTCVVSKFPDAGIGFRFSVSGLILLSVYRVSGGAPAISALPSQPAAFFWPGWGPVGRPSPSPVAGCKFSFPGGRGRRR